jgi:uncharacterized membrane protein (UPF0127 family)
MRSGWLLRDGDVVCALEMTDSWRERSRGLRGRPECEGALLLEGQRLAHTLGVSFAVDVAFLDDDLVVQRVARLAPWRVARPYRGVRALVQAQAGCWEKWGVRVGDVLVIREVQPTAS